MIGAGRAASGPGAGDEASDAPAPIASGPSIGAGPSGRAPVPAAEVHTRTRQVWSASETRGAPAYGSHGRIGGSGTSTRPVAQTAGSRGSPVAASRRRTSTS